MITRTLTVFCGVALSLGLVSCRRITEVPNQPLKVEPAKYADAIPAEYGNLVGVTQQSVNFALLWFEKPDKTIAIVAVQIQGNTVGLGQTVAMIPRK